MDRLKVGDVIRVNNPLKCPEESLYPVTRIVGNRAYTRFRVFNVRIYCGSLVYEYGKRLSPIYNNQYVVEKRAD